VVGVAFHVDDLPLGVFAVAARVDDDAAERVSVVRAILKRRASAKAGARSKPRGVTREPAADHLRNDRRVTSTAAPVVP